MNCSFLNFNAGPSIARSVLTFDYLVAHDNKLGSKTKAHKNSRHRKDS